MGNRIKYGAIVKFNCAVVLGRAMYTFEDIHTTYSRGMFHARLQVYHPPRL